MYSCAYYLLMPNQLGRTQYSLPRFVMMPWPGWPCWRIGGKVFLTVSEKCSSPYGGLTA